MKFKINYAESLTISTGIANIILALFIGLTNKDASANAIIIFSLGIIILDRKK